MLEIAPFITQCNANAKKKRRHGKRYQHNYTYLYGLRTKNLRTTLLVSCVSEYCAQWKIMRVIVIMWLFENFFFLKKNLNEDENINCSLVMSCYCLSVFCCCTSHATHGSHAISIWGINWIFSVNTASWYII